MSSRIGAPRGPEAALQRERNIRVGVDSGGTFTDIASWDGARLRVAKTPSTPDNPARAVTTGVAGDTPSVVIHGTTVATNTLLERHGARTAFVTTRGFEDLLVLGRQNREHLYRLVPGVREPLVPRELCFGAPERVLADGTARTQLDHAWCARLRERLLASRVESVAVCLLHSYANPVHERMIGEALSGLSVSLSSQILPEYREYERASTTVANALVAPKMSAYLRDLAGRFADSDVRVFQSNGGQAPAGLVARHPVRTVLSGPAGGLAGAVAVAREAGFGRIISFDMGGTSTDVALYDGRFAWTSQARVGAIPVALPMLDIHTVGAGGGSIARWDAGGALRVGPRSAGASPGPACYGKGDSFTVTDANLLLGRIDPDRFLDGAMRLDVARAARAADNLATIAGVDRGAISQAVTEVANANMERAIRVISVERGYDPREFTLVGFGGAAAQHACDLADRLEMTTVLIPRHAGVLSALGMLAADAVEEASRSALGTDPETVLGPLRTELLDGRGDGVICQESVDLRYRGQSYELTVPWSERANFHAIHEKRFGYRHPDRPVEAVTVRVRVATPGPGLPDNLGSAEAPAFASLHVPAGWRAREDASKNVVLERAC